MDSIKEAFEAAYRLKEANQMIDKIEMESQAKGISMKDHPEYLQLIEYLKNNSKEN